MLDVLVEGAALIGKFLETLLHVGHTEITKTDIEFLVGENIHVELHIPGNAVILDRLFFRFLAICSCQYFVIFFRKILKQLLEMGVDGVTKSFVDIGKAFVAFVKRPGGFDGVFMNIPFLMNELDQGGILQ